MDDLTIEFHHNMAIVTGRVVVSNEFKGEVTKNEYRVTHVWVRESGNWKRAGFHDGKVK